MEKMHLAEVTSGCEWAPPAGKAGHVRYQQLRYLGTCKVYGGDKACETAMGEFLVCTWYETNTT